MDFTITSEQKELKANARKFAHDRLNDDLIGHDKNSILSKESWKECAKFGLHGIVVPEKYGGTQRDKVTATLIMEGVGHGCKDNGLLFSVNAQLWSFTAPLLQFGTDEQKKAMLPGLCAGNVIGANAMTEPDSGSDAFGLRTTADKQGSAYILNGTKTFVTNGPIADVVIVYARMKSSPTKSGITAFLVRKDSPGFSISKEIPKMGLRTSPFGELSFDNCKVASSDLLGEEGMGEIIFNSSMIDERIFIMAAHVGAMERQLGDCVKYAKDRKQFQKRIFDFQSIGNLLAEMKVRLESSRLFLYQAAWLRESGKSAVVESSIAKLHISESWVQNNLSDLKIHGGYGYCVEYGIERQLRDSLGSLFYSGTSEIQKNIIANLLE